MGEELEVDNLGIEIQGDFDICGKCGGNHKFTCHKFKCYDGGE